MSKTSTASKRKYNEKSYDRISVVVKKGQHDVIKNYAESRDMSLNGFINYLIEKEMRENPTA